MDEEAPEIGFDGEPCALKGARTVRRGEQRVFREEPALLPYLPLSLRANGRTERRLDPHIASALAASRGVQV